VNLKSVKAWIMYDWAHSAFSTTMLAAVLPIFYVDIAASTLDKPHLASSYWGITQTVAMLIVAILSPILGAISDYSGAKVRLIRFFTITGSIVSMMFALLGHGDYILASCFFILALISFSSATTLSDGLLPDLVPDEQRDYISAKGYTFGYIGGGILLVVNLAFIMKPGWFMLGDEVAGIRAAFISVGIWWFFFSLPLFRHVADKLRPERKTVVEYSVIGFKRIARTFRSIRQYPELLKFLLAFWFFNDGITTIITMATAYGREIGIDRHPGILHANRPPFLRVGGHGRLRPRGESGYRTIYLQPTNTV
jgi:UMF1 family MFS transporter